MNNNLISISDADKTNYKCFKLPDESVYYGEIAYLDEFNNAVIINCLFKKIKDVDESKEELLKNLKLARNGIGAQLYNLTETGFSSKYEGQWQNDKKHGRGLFVYSDKSKYDGIFVNDQYEGLGKFTWPNNNCYFGNWRCGRMDGEGEFCHFDGHILKGSFRNNYYYDVNSGLKLFQKEKFINPFLSDEDVINFKVKSSEYMAKYNKIESEKFSRNNMFRVLYY